MGKAQSRMKQAVSKKIYYLVIFSCLASVMPVKGQIKIDSFIDRLPLLGNQNVEALRMPYSATIEEVIASNEWKPYETRDIASKGAALWLTFEVENRLKDTVQAYLYSHVLEATIYRQRGQGYDQIKNGYYVPRPQRANKSQYYFTNLTFPPSQTVRLYIRLDEGGLNVSSILYSEKAYLERSQGDYSEQVGSIVFNYFYIFSLVTLIIFILVLWLRVGGRLYFYYLGYLFFLLVFGFIVLHETLAPVGNLFQYAPKLSNQLNDPVQFAFITFYIFFIINLLRVKQYDKLLARILKYLAFACLIYAVCRFLLNVLFFETAITLPLLYNAVRLIILPINFVLIFWIIYKVKHPLLSYFIIGQSLFFIGAVLGTYINYAGLEFIPGHFFSFKEAPNIVFQIGLIGEVYCFSLALGKNVSLMQEEKERTDAALIEQFKENERLQKEMNIELDIKVREKTVELVQLYAEIEQEREQKIKSEFTKKIKETEMVALRSQMNPHFIFNSMNAIKNLIMTSRNEDAMTYLDDFSSLLRHILKNASHQEITVEEELEILELYLSLEQSRMGSGFCYQVHVSSKEELSQYYIPPLLLQPIVENAIWHGLHPSLKAEKRLDITFDTNDNLKIIIQDNGIGRRESAKKTKLHEAMGTTLIRDRLALHNHLNDDAIVMQIDDLEYNDRAQGTRVSLIYNIEQ